MNRTIAHFRLKPGIKDEFIKAMNGLGDAMIPGWITHHYFQMDKDANECYLVMLVEGKKTYQANTDSAEQHQCFLKIRFLLVDDPEWYDDYVISGNGPGARMCSDGG